MKWQSMLKVILVNLLLIFIGLVTVELLFGTWFSDVHALYQFTKPRSIRIVQKNPFFGHPAKLIYTRDMNGFRGLVTPVDRITIITVGGSTTDQRFIDDSVTFQKVLEQNFRRDGRWISIANAGIDGQSTFGHISNFSSWFNKVDGLKADYILYYLGHNDLLKISTEAMFDDTEAKRKVLRIQLYIREKSALYQLYLVMKTILKSGSPDHSFNCDNNVGRGPYTTTGLVTNYNTAVVQSSFKSLQDRIRQLEQLTRRFGAKSIFVTQRSARWKRQDGRILGIAEYKPDFHRHILNVFPRINGVDFYNLERMMADAIMSTCKDVNAICIDLMSEIKFDLTKDFYDPIHTTASGSKAIGRYLYRKLKDQI